MKRMLGTVLLSVTMIGASADSAFAWDFSCSPKESTEIVAITPNVLLMLDRSGSMDDDDGRITNTCKVCEDADGYFEVASAADCAGATPWSVSDESHIPQDSVPSGYSHSFSFAGLPAATQDLELEIEIRGDINDTCEYADVYVDGDLLYTLEDLAQCNTRVRTVTVPRSYAADGVVDVEIRTSPDGNSCQSKPAACVSTGDCDGVDPDCLDNYAIVTLSQVPLVYRGTQQWLDPCGEADKWEQSVDAIDRLTFESDSATPELARFGLGLYHDTSSSVAEECESMNHSDIMSILGPYDTGTACPTSSTCPNGNTPTARAIRTARNSDCVGGATTRPTATILINDGQPTRNIDGNAGGDSNYRDAVAQACLHRDQAPLYIVGLGAGTDEDFNNILAAAGGTGRCTDAAMETDPCDDVDGWESFRGDCSGSIQADNGEALLAALTDITAELACTFPVNFLDSGVAEVPEDATSEYEFLYVEAQTVTGTTARIPFQGSASATPPGQGWEFTGVPRQYVRLTGDYCDAVRRTDYSEVSTQLACLCQEETGSRCDVDNWEANGTCPEGSWICVEGTDICEPDAECCVPGPCDTGLPGICAPGEIICDGTQYGTCTQTVFPEEEICDGLDNDCDGEVDEGIGGDCSVPGAFGRCIPGEIQCVDGAEVCTSIYDPMPELCNGLDDDCDGDVDNISQSWERPEFSGHVVGGSDAGKACRFISACMCPNGTDNHAGHNFGQYIANWDPVCQCGEGLQPDDDATEPRPADATQPAATCAAAGGDRSASGWLVLLVGALLLSRRRD